MRYIKAALVIGLLSALITSALYALGLTRGADVALAGLFRFDPALGIALKLEQFAAIVVMAFLISWTSVDVSRTALKVILAAFTVLLLLSGSWVLALYKVFLSPFPACAAALVSLGIALVYGRSDAGSRKQVLERLFGQRVSKRQLSALVNSSQPLNFPGAKLDVSVVVCEIGNQTDLQETLKPEDYVAMTNLYLRAASDFLVEAGGYLDQCDGEGLRVIFGAPIEDSNHAATACRTALDLLTRLDLLNKDCDAQWCKRFDFRVGVSSGETVAAAFGGARLGSFSVAGNTVEFARRLSRAAGEYGARLLVGPDTFELTSGSFEARPIELLRQGIGGRRLEIYEFLSRKGNLSMERARSRDHFWKGVIYFRERKWTEAVEEFSKARIPGLPDPVLDYYVQRVERTRRQDRSSQEAEVPILAA